MRDGNRNVCKHGNGKGTSVPRMHPPKLRSVVSLPTASPRSQLPEARKAITAAARSNRLCMSVFSSLTSVSVPSPGNISHLILHLRNRRDIIYMCTVCVCVSTPRTPTRLWMAAGRFLSEYRRDDSPTPAGRACETKRPNQHTTRKFSGSLGS
jgi:hypothetical protein